jgi:hypothetical protein
MLQILAGAACKSGVPPPAGFKQMSAWWTAISILNGCNAAHAGPRTLSQVDLITFILRHALRETIRKNDRACRMPWLTLAALAVDKGVTYKVGPCCKWPSRSQSIEKGC